MVTGCSIVVAYILHIAARVNENFTFLNLNYSKLKNLRINGNRFSGAIPVDFMYLQSLDYFDFDNNEVFKYNLYSFQFNKVLHYQLNENLKSYYSINLIQTAGFGNFYGEKS